MGHRVWIAGLALILGTQGIWAETQPTEPSADQAQTTQAATQTKTQAQGRLRRAGNPLLEAAASDGKGCFSSTAAASTEALRRNAFMDIDMSDSLVYCLQGTLCSDSCASLMILNIADPTDPKFVSRIRFHGGAEVAYRLKVLGDYAYLTVAAPADQTAFYVIDVSDPHNPFIAGNRFLDGVAGGIEVRNNLVFVVKGTSNTHTDLNMVLILDVSNPSQIDSIGCAATYYGLDEIRVRGDLACAVGYYDLYTVDVSTPTAAEVRSQFSTGYRPFGVEFGDSDTLVYVADADIISPAYWSAFTIVNISDPTDPAILSRFDLFGLVLDVRVQDHWAYVSHGSCGLQVFDVTNPVAPDSVVRFEVPLFAGYIAVDDTILVLPDVGPFMIDAESYACYPPTPGPGEPQEGDLLILSIADPANPRLLGFYSPTPEDPTPVDDPKPELLPTTFTLYHNYPNPFNPSTTIRYDLPVASEVRLEIINLLGQRVTTLVDETLPAGEHTVVWNGRDQSGGEVASGIYFYRLIAGEYTESRKMMMLK